jgi:predicted phosphoribosyltransferase
MKHRPYFRNRKEAGRALAQRLNAYADRPDVVVVALPPGGVPVAYELAHALNVALDVVLASAISVEGNPDRPLLAVGSGGMEIVNPQAAHACGIAHAEIAAMARREHHEINLKELIYRGERPSVDLSAKALIVVDEGAVTGITLLHTVRLLRTRRPVRIVVAVPVSPPEACEKLRNAADDVVCVHTPAASTSVEEWYQDFPPVSAEDVRKLLEHIAPAQTVPGARTRTTG